VVPRRGRVPRHLRVALEHPAMAGEGTKRTALRP
jgi:hypothetical protein